MGYYKNSFEFLKILEADMHPINDAQQQMNFNTIAQHGGDYSKSLIKEIESESDVCSCCGRKEEILKEHKDKYLCETCFLDEVINNE